MTKVQVNIAIAEARGWKRVRETAYGPMGCPPGSDLSCTSDDFFRTRMCPVPNCHENLDAMHEAEATLNYEQAEQYEDELCDICYKENYHKEYPLPFRFAIAHATSRQRAEAFLRTIGKWEE